LCIAIGGTAAWAQTPATPAAPAVVTRSAMPTVSTGARTAVPARAGAPAALPGTRETAFSTIRVNALDSTGGILPDSPVRLRDARLGRTIGTQRTDTSGVFEFRGVDPGSYIAELLGPTDSVLAASQLINVNAREAVSTTVKLPFRLPPLGRTLR